MFAGISKYPEDTQILSVIEKHLVTHDRRICYTLPEFLNSLHLDSIAFTRRNVEELRDY